jgi:hypothetical protein
MADLQGCLTSQVLLYLEIDVSVPQFEEILCKIKHLYVNVLLPYNRTMPIPDVEYSCDGRAVPLNYLFNYLNSVLRRGF